jgi:hypothetical protein
LVLENAATSQIIHSGTGPVDPFAHSDTQIKLDRALSERTLLQTRLLKFRTTADLLHDEKSQTRKDQRAAPWERFGAFELKLQDLEIKLSTWEEKIVDVEDRLVRLDEYCEELFALEGTPATYILFSFPHCPHPHTFAALLPPVLRD